MKNIFSARFFLLLILIVTCGYGVFSCNKSYRNELEQFGDYDDTSVLVTNPKKVLYIIIDGGNGQLVKSLKLPNINKLAANGTYTWNSLSGIRVQDSALPASWSNLMTGTSSDKVNISTSFDENRLSQYPDFITRIKTLDKEDLKISVSSSSVDFDKYFAAAADVHKIFSNDGETASALASEVKGENDIVIGEFNSAYEAGLNSAFDSTSGFYISALKNIDTYIGSVVSSLKSRPTYDRERWMIIVTSTANLSKNISAGSDPSLYSNYQLNTFTIFSSDRFNENYIDKPADTRGTVAYQTSALRFRGDFGDKNDGNRISITDNKKLYNCPPGDSLTIEAKVKINPTSSGSFSYSYPPFISKVQSRYGNYTGWSFFRTGNNIAFFTGLGDSKIEVDGNSPITDNLWHTITGKIIWDQNYLSTYLYIDGVIAGSGSAIISSISPGMINNTYPLIIGYWPNVFSTAYLDSYIKDVRIWNTALSDAQIASYSCFPSELLPASLPLDKLVGDFRIDENDGNDVAKDYSSYRQDGVYDIAANGKMAWKSFNEVSNAICPPATDDFYNASIKGVDIPYEIYTWLGINIDSLWKLDGKFWQPSFNTDSQS